MKGPGIWASQALNLWALLNGCQSLRKTLFIGAWNPVNPWSWSGWCFIGGLQRRSCRQAIWYRRRARQQGSIGLNRKKCFTIIMMNTTITSWCFCLNVAWRLEWLYRRMRNRYTSHFFPKLLTTVPLLFVKTSCSLSFFLAIPFEKWSWLGQIQSFPAVSQHCRVRLLMKSFFHCCGSKVCNPQKLYVEGEKRSGIDRDPNKISVAMDITSFYQGPWVPLSPLFTFRKLVRWGEEAKANVSMCAKTLQQTQEMLGDAAIFVCLDPHWSAEIGLKVFFLLFSMGTNEKSRNCQRVLEISLFPNKFSFADILKHSRAQSTNIKFQNEISIAEGSKGSIQTT